MYEYVWRSLAKKLRNSIIALVSSIGAKTTNCNGRINFCCSFFFTIISNLGILFCKKGNMFIKNYI